MARTCLSNCNPSHGIVHDYISVIQLVMYRIIIAKMGSCQHCYSEIEDNIVYSVAAEHANDYSIGSEILKSISSRSDNILGIMPLPSYGSDEEETS